MRDHDNDEPVGRIAVQAAHDAGRVPLVYRHVLDGVECVVNSRFEKDEKVDSADRDDPIEEKSERAEIEQRIPLGWEDFAETGFGDVETTTYEGAKDLHQGLTPCPDERRHSRISATMIRLKLANPIPMLMNSE